VSAFARIIALAVLLAGSAPALAQSDALPSWNDGPAKQAIVDFVKLTTTQGSPKFVPPGQRIATFDQDGTLWVEHPMYSQMVALPGRSQVVNATARANASEGVSHPRVCRGHPFSSAATFSSRAWLYTERSVPFGKDGLR
jgi:hypothetical protein